MRPALFVALFLVSAALAPAAQPAHRTAPRIISVKPIDEPIAGQPVRIEINVRDPLAAVNGVQVDYGDFLGAVKESACREKDGATMDPFKPGGAVSFVVTHTYLLPGDYDLDVTATSGDCVLGPLMGKRKLRIKVREPRPNDLVRARPAQASPCAGANTAPTRTTTAASWRTMLCLVNTLRRANGLGTLKSNRRLRTAATRHARDMVTRGYFAHESPNGVDLTDRLRRVRYRRGGAAENIGAGSDALTTPAAILVTWMDSPPHKANLLDRDYSEAGVGLVIGFPGGGPGATYVMDFGRR
jgi:uncharacterized protein YkwD